MGQHIWKGGGGVVKQCWTAQGVQTLWSTCGGGLSFFHVSCSATCYPSIPQNIYNEYYLIHLSSFYLKEGQFWTPVWRGGGRGVGVRSKYLGWLFEDHVSLSYLPFPPHNYPNEHMSLILQISYSNLATSVIGSTSRYYNIAG